MDSYNVRLQRGREAFLNAETVLIGGGAGLSDAAGLTYSGPRFQERFGDFIETYNLTDMYTASFYPFSSEEETWAYWARHIACNRWEPPALPLYRSLYQLVKKKEFFVITTNVDAQFEKAGFPSDRLFAVQGDYGMFQCATRCHDTLYGNKSRVEEMLEHTAGCKIPPHLVPRCPMCGGKMDVHVRKDNSFVEDAAWRKHSAEYTMFLREAISKPLILLEIGVGYNTPGIIRFPFEQITYQNPQATLLRLNRDQSEGMPENLKRTIAFQEDIAVIFKDLQERGAAS
ncbi:MAG: Sir2 silent information regulator family NAD-dependent deacetylase [Clostridiales bacterium]|nr:Sir2 silent information regulator family NAD-dependent deacetylase [Clostridiales bacterium]